MTTTLFSQYMYTHSSRDICLEVGREPDHNQYTYGGKEAGSCSDVQSLSKGE